MAWDDSEFTSPDYSLYTGPSDYSFDPSFTDFYGDSSYLPAEMDYQSLGYENPTFNLYDQLAQSGLIGQDAYGMPDLSALYSLDPSTAADIGAGATYSPGEITELTSSVPMQNALLASAADPEAMSGIQQVGDGTYLDSNTGQLMDAVQYQDRLNQIAMPGLNLDYGTGLRTSEGLDGGRMMGLQGKNDWGIKTPGLTTYTDGSGRILDTGAARTVNSLDEGRGITFPGAPRGTEGYVPGGLEDLLSQNMDPESWSSNEGRGIQDYLRSSGEGATIDRSPERTTDLMALLRAGLGGMGGGSSPTSTSGNKNSTLPLQQRNPDGSLTKAQTAMNTAAMATMIAEALRNKSVKAGVGTGDLRGADQWSVGRAAGSGRKRKNMATGGLAAYAGRGKVSDPHASGGQADTVHAALSGGEYVLDADIVSALGDGDTNAGADRLDQMRQSIRKHKRSAPAGKIPPKAKSPLEYMKGAK